MEGCSFMKIHIDEEFLSICKKIKEKNLSVDEWRLVESDDMFQSSNFCGGYDTIEDAFCFSYYDQEKKEFWFQIDLSEIGQILDGVKTSLSVRSAC